MMNFPFYLIVFISLLFSSCSLVELDEPTEENPNSDIDLPTAIPASMDQFNQAFHGGSEQSWKARSFELAGFDGLQGCRLDDTMLIKADGTYQYDGGEILCGAEDDRRMKTGTWVVINDGKNIIFDQGTPQEYVARVSGLQAGVIALSGQYIGLAITGVYQVK